MKHIPAVTCTRAWLDAASYLQTQPDHRDYNLVLEITDPMSLPPEEKQVYGTVDAFLTKHKKQTVNSVINTIFPAGFYARYGPKDVIANYGKIARKVRGHPDNRRWGTYACRIMTARKDAKNQDFVPLQVIIEKLQAQLKNTSTLRAAYELNLIDPMVDIPIYEAELDKDNTIGGPCLSHLSFKLKHDHRLMLTAFYRSHYYLQRALGNLFGLAWLQDFVAKNVGIKSAELVCISSMAVVESDRSWGQPEVESLLKRCRKFVGAAEPAVTAVASLATTG